MNSGNQNSSVKTLIRPVAHHPFSYQTGKLPIGADNAVVNSFDSLTPSQYKDGSYRLRRYSNFDYNQDNKTVQLRANEAFVQSDELNQFQGNVARQYDDLTADTINAPEFIAMLDAFCKSADLPSSSKIEIHQMRIIAKDNADAVATPEGIHQDGFDVVGVFTMARQNVKGGELMLWQHKTDDKPLATLVPERGDFCVLNDKTLWHSAGNVTPKTDGKAYWDLFVLTANR